MSKVGEITIEVVRMSESILIPHFAVGINLSPLSEVHEKALKGNAKSNGVM